MGMRFGGRSWTKTSRCRGLWRDGFNCRCSKARGQIVGHFWTTERKPARTTGPGLHRVEADGGGVAVGVEAFDFAEGADGGEEGGEGFAVEADEAGAALELVDGEA